jgi:fucose 4-O-acetylase-like acetyltransferase
MAPMITTTRLAHRDQRLDVARGAAIIAIVVVHVVRGLQSAGLVDLDVKILTDRSVGLWCLSVFAFVGGTFVPKAVEKVGLREYVGDRVTRFSAVYLIWSILQGSLHLLAGSEANHRRSSIGQVFEIWRPDGQLWYLPFLILVTLIFVPMRPWLARRAPAVLAIAATVSVVCWGFDGGYVGKQGLGLVVFFVAGMVMGTAKIQAALDRFSVAQAVVISVVALPVTSILCIRTRAIPPTYYWFEATPARIAIGVVLSVVASAAILLFGQAARSVSFLALCGRRSLDIYLAHIILASGTRIVLLELGIGQIWILVALCVAVAVVGSLMLTAVLRRIHLSWVLDGPNWLTTVGRNQTTP